MAKFHFNKETGRTGKCDAKIQCRLGLSEEQHFSSLEDAQRGFEIHMENEVNKSIAPSLKKGETKLTDVVKDVTKIIKNEQGSFQYNSSGELHNENGPAVIRTNGSREWFVNGKRHNNNGPAIEKPNGTKIYYQHGNLHNENGPAVDGANGKKEWYLNGELHNENGPARILPNGQEHWFINGSKVNPKTN